MDDPGLFRIKTAAITVVIILLIDAYAFQALRTVLRGKPRGLRVGVFVAHWGVSFTAIVAALWNNLADPMNHYSLVREWLAGIVAPVYLSKLTALVVIVADDLRRLGLWVARRWRSAESEADDSGQKIPRSVFLNKAAVIAGAVPFTAFTYGILGGGRTTTG
jgi:uncharacterized protein